MGSVSWLRHISSARVLGLRIDRRRFYSVMPRGEESAAGAEASASAVEASPGMSKKAAQKAAKKAEKELRQAAALAAAAAEEEEIDPLADKYGDTKLEDLQSKAVTGRKWTEISELGTDLEGSTVLVRGRVHSKRAKGKMAFLVLRETIHTVQCVVSMENVGSKQFVKYASLLSKESVVDVTGNVSNPRNPVSGTTQPVEIQVTELHCISRSTNELPLLLEDAARSDQDIEKAAKEGIQYARVLQDTRLNNRVLDLRIPANQAIFTVQSEISSLFHDFLRANKFRQIHTPKLIAGASEGGSAVFKLQYANDQPACLAQSPQLHKQMAICGDFRRVFEIGPVFRAEKSFTHRHLCEFIGLDFEMEIKEHYFEIIDLIGKLFIYVFNELNKNCKKELETINSQYPFEPLQYLDETLVLAFAEGIQMLKEAGFETDPLGDLDTETERRLGLLVKERYKTDFYILHRYPLAVRPFYTMPAVDDPKYSNSFDVFIRGEEIISGAQRVHDKDLLLKRIEECNIDPNAIGLQNYINSFSYGAPPHGGIGVGLERVAMLFCNLDNIRKVSLFPRDPNRLAP
ncbi:aspartate--tRNA ligase 1, cytoplasmic [Selaginella moellendorffii]|nr:aspartate--tRNA ligase 1, cytoplasmic [Selaginella moellendorffii]|eukprot:XP_002965575.2 aspartate--tRNA ligase 1, cytoplasmic [Selaginella moellendorffii]